MRVAARVALVAALATAGCAHLADGTGPPSELKASPGWVVVPALRFHPQRDAHGCGPAALGMVLEAWGRSAAPAPAEFADLPDDRGVTAGHLRDVARRAGLSAFVLPGTEADLDFELERGHPVVLGIASRQGLRQYAHFVVLAGRERSGRHWLIADPDHGWRVVARDVLDQQWRAAGRTMLVVYPGLTASTTWHGSWTSTGQQRGRP